MIPRQSRRPLLIVKSELCHCAILKYLPSYSRLRNIPSKKGGMHADAPLSMTGNTKQISARPIGRKLPKLISPESRQNRKKIIGRLAGNRCYSVTAGLVVQVQNLHLYDCMDAMLRRIRDSDSALLVSLSSLASRTASTQRPRRGPTASS